MGTTLTGTTPQDTYDSLIKVTDNGPLSGSLKVLTDGLGNNSAISLSTSAASVTGTLAVSGNATFDTSTLVVDAANNRVGINKAVPTSDLDVSGTFAASSSVTAASLFVLNTDGALGNINSSAANGGYFTWQTSSTTIADIGTAQQIFGSGGNDTFGINARGARALVFGSNNTERVRITSTGVLELAQGQLKFPATQVASADANTLDDYEEGTFTPSLQGITGTITYSAQTGSYTKIGNVVNVRFRIALASYSSTAGLNPFVNLPFTSANVADQFNNSALFLENTTYVGQSFAWINPNGAIFFPASIATGGVFTHINNLAYTSTTTITGNITYFTA